MKKLLIIISVILSACTTPTDVAKETVIQGASVSIAEEKTVQEKEKTQQLKYQWKIDSLKTVQNKN